MKEYRTTVEREEIHTVSDGTLNLERSFQAGKRDRKAGEPCKSANGAYLNGWYSPDTDYYYITKDAARLL